jgi:DNA-binding NtrC family response regulator
VTRKSDVRLVSATNVDIPRAIAAGQFREDLYFRLNVIELYVPPLADRPEDILPLAEHFVVEHAAREQKAGMKLGDDAVAALLNHDWPGNVRELQNRIQRAVLVETSPVISAGDLGITSETRRAPEPRRPAPTPAEAADPDRGAIEDALIRAGGVVAKAAAEMGLSRQALYRRMERLGIVLERRPR